jgi:hypothetical protein
VVAPDDGVGLVYAGGVDQFAAAGTGDGLLVGAVLAEPGVVGLSVGADGRDRDLGGADGATDRFWEQMDATGLPSRPTRA